MVTKLASIVVPVHNEAALIESFLAGLSAMGVLDDYEVVIGCNACHDDTARLARTYDGVVVAETDEGGKYAGLNLGDDHATVMPRIYLDVDVQISRAALDRLAHELSTGPTLAAAPRLIVDLKGRSWPVRAYYAIWMRLPWVLDEMIGSGVFGVSEAGRARFDRFPHDVVDDLYVSAHFAPGERRNLDDVTFTVPSSPTLADVIQRKSRLLTYNRRTAEHIADLPGRPASRSSFVRVAAPRPWLWPAALVYAYVAFTADRRAQERMRTEEFSWDGSQRDD
ncbi:MAG: glycosyltransferase [Actinomycetota bacterium]